VPLLSAQQNKESEKGLFDTTGGSGESTGRSQNISIIVPLFTFAGHYRGIRML
jgi:hypothetical protein